MTEDTQQCLVAVAGVVIGLAIVCATLLNGCHTAQEMEKEYLKAGWTDHWDPRTGNHYYAPLTNAPPP